MLQTIPVIPESITVHLGTPASNAPNVTLPFIDYVKNVASSEVYPTWEPSALRANILAIVSFALNRVYLEYYRSRGYDFDITSTTAYDQSFVNERSTFESIDRIVDEIFDDYLRRQGFVEPLAAKFCNGTTSTCEGLSQWGSQGLAQQGYNSVQILRTYYGDNVEIVPDAPVRNPAPSYPGTPLRRGDVSSDVARMQYILNRVSQNYPAIPKINPVDGIFGQQTEDAVRAFQSIFDLTVDGIVGKATWNELTRLYVAVNRLAELQSLGVQFTAAPLEFPEALQEGNTGEDVRQLQYMLRVLAQFITEIPAPEINGSFDTATRQAVLAFQRWTGLNQTGLVGAATWNRLYSEFEAVEGTLQQENAVASDQQANRSQMMQFPGYPLAPGTRDEGQEVGQ